MGESVENKLLFNIQSVFADYEKAKKLDRLRRGKLFSEMGAYIQEHRAAVK
jgi:hypothetical protein